MKRLSSMLLLLFATFFLATSFAAGNVKVIEGKEAKALYAKQKDKTVVIEQKKKLFYLKKAGDKKLKRKPKEAKVKAGEPFFILNTEKEIVHNVYDTVDESWVLSLQQPGGVAAVTFDKPGVHELKCAIHPKMKLKLIVE